MAKLYLTNEQCVARYPRLATACQWVAILSRSEAGCAIRDYRSPDPDIRRYGGGEAVDHYGGPEKVVQRAVQARSAARAMNGGTLLR